MADVIGPKALKERTQSINNMNVQRLLNEIGTHLTKVMVYDGGRVKVGVSIDPNPYKPVLTRELCSGSDGWSSIETESFWGADHSAFYYVILIP